MRKWLCSLVVLGTWNGIAIADDRLQGRWEGRYDCNTQPSSKMVLTIDQAGGDGVGGTFEFVVGAARGTFKITGSVDAKGVFQLEPGQWIRQPRGFTALAMEGRVLPGGASIEGAIPGCAGRFRAARAGKAETKVQSRRPTPVLDAAAPPVPTPVEANSITRCEDIRKSLVDGGLLKEADSASNPIAKAVTADCDLAQAGDPAAQNRFGKMLLRRKSDNEAVHWFRKSVAQGNADAVANLGIAYYRGAGVPRDHNEAARLITRAADAGSAYGKAALGDFLLTGWLDGLPQDRERGWKLLQEAAELGDGYAAQRVGNSMLKENPKEGIRWLRTASERGDAYGIYSLGYLYLAGSYGITKDVREFSRLAHMAAAGGHEDAQAHIAAYYRNGSEGFPKNYALAKYWYGQAAAQGHRESARALNERKYWESGPPLTAKDGATIAAVGAFVVIFAYTNGWIDTGPVRGCPWGSVDVGHGTCMPFPGMP